MQPMSKAKTGFRVEQTATATPKPYNVPLADKTVKRPCQTKSFFVSVAADSGSWLND